ncbi:MAG TPA: GAF domain-containing sensor histidine kinase [Bacteroidota bacterium]|nr:GAF domain-containing sensor histidine kinase [Bacteroidota bacterium]
MKLNELLDRKGMAGFEEAKNSSNGSYQVQELKRILTVVKSINNSLVFDEVLRLVVDNAIDVAKAERGFLLLADNDGKLQFNLARNSSGESINPDDALISRTIAEDVYQTGESVFIENALANDRCDTSQSIVSLSLQTILCSPLTIKSEKIGVIYVDSRSILAVSKDDIIDLFEILAGQAAIAIKNAQLYEKLRGAYNDLEDANEQVMKFERMASRGEMAAEVSHELKNSLSVVMLQLQSLQNFWGRCSAEERSKKLAGAIDSLKKTILFTSGLIETSAFKTNKYPGSLNEAIRNFIKFLKILPRFRSPVLITTLDDSAPDCLFDQQQLQQVLLNLVTNAVESYSEATIEIRTVYFPEQSEIRISVIDNGPGIIEEVRKKIFTQKITTKVDGHGYGLPICKKIVDNHGGRISVESTIGQGTSFHITFPAGVEQPA